MQMPSTAILRFFSMVPPSLRLVSFLKAETFERGQHIIKEGEVPFDHCSFGGMLNDL